MKTIGSSRPLRLAQSRMRREIVTLFKGAAAQARVILLSLADTSGHIQGQSAQRLALTRVGQLVSDLFTGADNRSAFADDGITAVAPYPRILNTWLVWSTYQAVKQQESWLKAHVPEAVFQFLRRGKRKIISEIAPEDLFSPYPFAEIDPNRRWVPFHKWQDERGYRLSDRIWRSDLETRRKIDELLTRGLREGQSALDLAAALEAYLVPGREGIRTLKPYGRRFQPGGASADAMRLARTEVARAFNQAAWVSAYLNPYVGGIDIARSANGDPACPICPNHATIGLYGERLRDPYPLDSSDVGPYHPHCLCYVLSVVTDNPAAVTARLRSMMQDTQAELGINPADARAFAQELLGSGFQLPQIERAVNPFILRQQPLNFNAPSPHDKLAAYEKSIINQTIEHMLGLDRDGNEIFRVVGQQKTVTVDTSQWEMIRGGFATHNHPILTASNGDLYGGDSLSLNDFIMATKYNLQQLDAVGVNPYDQTQYRYIFQRPASGWRIDASNAEAFIQRREEIVDSLAVAARERIKAGTSTLHEEEFKLLHDSWEILSREYGFIYNRVVIGG